MKATPDSDPAARGGRSSAMSGGLLLQSIRGGKPGRTVGVTAHALAVRARPCPSVDSAPSGPAAFASAHLPEHSFSQAPGPGPRSAKIIRNERVRRVSKEMTTERNGVQAIG
jgi:hypothetical protein